MITADPLYPLPPPPPRSHSPAAHQVLRRVIMTTAEPLYPLPPPPTSLSLPCRSSSVKTCDCDNSRPPLPPSFPFPRSHSPAVHQVLRRVIMITAEPLYPLPSLRLPRYGNSRAPKCCFLGYGGKMSFSCRTVQTQ